MRFRESRINAGFTAKEAAERLGVSCAAVNYWESGACTPNAKRLPEIAKLYGVTVDDLLRKGDRDD